MSDSYDSTSRQIIFKAETTRGVYNAPDYSTDFNIIVNELDTSAPDGGHDGGVSTADGTQINSKSYSGKKQQPVSFNVDMQWSGDVLVAPKNWLLLENACGWVKTVDGINPAKIEWTGKPNCGGLSADIAKWKCGSDPEGIADVIAGIAGTVSFGAENVGAPVRMAFTLTGKSGGRKTLTTGTFATPSGQDTTDCSVYLGGSINKGATQIFPWSWNVDQGGDIQPVDKHDSTTNGVLNGIDYFKVANTDVQGTFDGTLLDLATIDNVSDMFDNVVYTTSVIELDHFTITLTTVQTIAVEEGNNNETVTDNETIKIDKITIEQKA